MLLVADIGNSQITLGAFEGERLRGSWRLESRPGWTARRLAGSVRGLLGPLAARVRALAYGSVVPDLEPVFDALGARLFGGRAVRVEATSPLGLRLRVDRPGEVGVDRALNALAALRLHGGPCVVVDFGTATTFDCVSGAGDYLGGAILIGPDLAAKALARGTAKLPLVAVRPAPRYIGKNTVDCMRVGLYQGYVGMLRGVLEGTLREMGAPRVRVKVLATGGWAGLFYKVLGVKLFAPDLTLQGLRLAHAALARQVPGKEGGFEFSKGRDVPRGT